MYLLPFWGSQKWEEDMAEGRYRAIQKSPNLQQWRMQILHTATVIHYRMYKLIIAILYTGYEPLTYYYQCVFK